MSGTINYRYVGTDVISDAVAIDTLRIAQEAIESVFSDVIKNKVVQGGELQSLSESYLLLQTRLKQIKRSPYQPISEHLAYDLFSGKKSQLKGISLFGVKGFKQGSVDIQTLLSFGDILVQALSLVGIIKDSTETLVTLKDWFFPDLEKNEPELIEQVAQHASRLLNQKGYFGHVKKKSDGTVEILISQNSTVLNNSVYDAFKRSLEESDLSNTFPNIENSWNGEGFDDPFIQGAFLMFQQIDNEHN